jgi:hypothetical protein
VVDLIGLRVVSTAQRNASNCAPKQQTATHLAKKKHRDGD